MTEQSKTKLGWITILGGIPLAVIVTWIFTAGILRGNFENVRAAAVKSEEINVMQDSRLLRLEVNYEHVRASIDEIKTDTRDIKKMLERRP